MRAAAPWRSAWLRSRLEVPAACPIVFGRAGTTATREKNVAALTGVRPMIERYPLAKAGDAYARMMSGKAEFRVVLTM